MSVVSTSALLCGEMNPSGRVRAHGRDCWYRPTSFRRFRAADILGPVPLIPLYGHEDLRRRLREAAGRGALPASILLHGPQGVGKQRLALWLGQMLLCPEADRPCGRCQTCRYALELT